MLNEDEANVNDPDIPVEVNDLINVALVPNEPEIPAAVKPLPPPSSFSFCDFPPLLLKKKSIFY